MRILESLREIENQIFKEKDESHDLVGAYLSESVDQDKLWEMIKNNDTEKIIEYLEEGCLGCEEDEEPEEITEDVITEKFTIMKLGDGVYSVGKGHPPIANARIKIEADSYEDAKDILIKSGYSEDELTIETLNESDSKVVVGIYGDEVPGFHSVDEIINYFIKKGIEVSDVDGDMEYGWEMNLTGDPRTLFFAVVNTIPGYRSDSVSEFIDQYRIDESLDESSVQKNYIYDGDIKFRDGSFSHFKCETKAVSPKQALQNIKYKFCVKHYGEASRYNLSRFALDKNALDEVTSAQPKETTSSKNTPTVENEKQLSIEDVLGK